MNAPPVFKLLKRTNKIHNSALRKCTRFAGICASAETVFVRAKPFKCIPSPKLSDSLSPDFIKFTLGKFFCCYGLHWVTSLVCSILYHRKWIRYLESEQSFSKSDVINVTYHIRCIYLWRHIFFLNAQNKDIGSISVSIICYIVYCSSGDTVCVDESYFFSLLYVSKENTTV